MSRLLATMVEELLRGKVRGLYLVARVALGVKVLSIVLRSKSLPDNISNSHYLPLDLGYAPRLGNVPPSGVKHEAPQESA